MVAIIHKSAPKLPDVPLVLDMITEANDRRLMNLILVVQEIDR